MVVQPFKIAIDDQVLDDLKQRLADTRGRMRFWIRDGTTAATSPILRSWSNIGGPVSIGGPRKNYSINSIISRPAWMA